MAINRMMMKRQMYEGGGLGLVPREQYGLGSFLKKTFKKITKPFVKISQKLVPKELAKPMMLAAPFLGPAAPLIYAAGSAKATGGIDPIKLALSAAPYVKFEGIKPVGYGGSKFGVFGGEEIGFGARNIDPSQELLLGDDVIPAGELRGTSIADQVDKFSDKQFDALAKGKGKKASIKEVALEQITDPGNIASAGIGLKSYIDAKKKELEDQGLEFTEEDYNAAVNEYYTQYQPYFERGFAKTGGIAQTREEYGSGGPSGNRLKQLYTLREEAIEKGDDDKVIELDQEIGLILKQYAKGGRVKLESGGGLGKLLVNSGLFNKVAEKTLGKKVGGKNLMAEKILAGPIILGEEDTLETDFPNMSNAEIIATADSNPFTKRGVVVPMKRPEQTEENTIVPLDEFEGKISNAIQGIRGGMDKDLMIEMLENQRQLLGIPEDKAKFAVEDYMSRFMRGMK
tara:strand:- start:261 stop:1628 length:1368 start_codon:yes stop_codon:yes gene_type:complete